jgi:multisubunit Na+/H+ antiporter MnhG subunit
MSVFLKAAGIGGSLLALIAVIIVFLKSVIGFIGFMTFAIKILIVLLFVVLFLGVAALVLRGIRDARRKKE